jgi:hypothetical protein
MSKQLFHVKYVLWFHSILLGFPAAVRAIITLNFFKISQWNTCLSLTPILLILGRMYLVTLSLPRRDVTFSEFTLNVEVKWLGFLCFCFCSVFLFH